MHTPVRFQRVASCDFIQGRSLELDQADLGDLDLWPFKSAWGCSSKLCNYGAEFALEPGQGLQLEEKPLDFQPAVVWGLFSFSPKKKKKTGCFRKRSSAFWKENIGI